MFLTTWIKPFVGWPIAIAVVISLVKCVKDLDNQDTPVIYINRNFWLMLALVLLFTAFTGIGGLFYQEMFDHAFRNAVFYDLVNYEWPVVRGNVGTGNVELLCYYHAFWLPAAALAKMTGSLFVGNMAQLIYAFIGFVMIAIFFFEFLGENKSKIWILIVLALYCGWDIVLFFIDNRGSIFGSNLNTYMTNKDLHMGVFSAPAFPTISLYIFNQGIAAWLAVGLLLTQRNNHKALILLYSLMFLFAPIPTFGLLPAMTYWVIKHLKSTASIYNVIGVIVFVIVGIYFMSNDRAKAVDQTQIITWGSAFSYFYRLGLFLLFSYVIYFPYVWQEIRKDTFFWIMFATVSIVPIFSLGGCCDLGWRVGLPMTAYFAFLVVKKLTIISTLPRYKAVALVVTLFVGAISSSGMYVKNIVMGYRCILSGVPLQQTCMTTVFDPEICCLRDNFVADGESIFTKYLMKENGDKETLETNVLGDKKVKDSN